MKIDGRRVIVTGASSGIGRSLFELLAEREATVLGAARRGESIRKTIRSLKAPRARLEAMSCDLSVRRDVDRLFKDVGRRWGGVDIFFANAGFAYYEKLGRPDWARIRALFDLNVFSVVYSLEKMAEISAGRDFHFVITASGVSTLAMPGYALYSASKAALERFVEAFRFEMGPGARISMVYPIATRTGFFAAAGRNVPVPWPVQDPRRVSRSIIRGVEKDRKRIHPSRLFRLTSFLDRFAPLIGRAYQKRAAGAFERWTAKQGGK
ncbi:MAG: SDR family NAD(P)-dependent oxidoreductase [Candidatus Aminicenantes bacterium]|nr:SDR family NAD(P)-dependent oxidoreductase [Candidatus Aminicenantes bacterium]